MKNSSNYLRYWVGGDWVRAVVALILGTSKPGVAMAELRMTETTSVALQFGWAARNRAATPAARGAEALVPMAWT